MKRSIQLTNDGSTTIALPNKGITYHSTSGAIGESLHVFINAGLQHFVHTQNASKVAIFEMGFGTGLNALLSWQFAQQHQVSITYTSVEMYPILPEEAAQLNYDNQLQMTNAFTQLHQCQWNKPATLNQYFTLTKKLQSLLDVCDNEVYNVIYFDAFAPNDQPELWTKSVFDKMYQMLQPNGILVTYCSKGEVRRNMLAAGFCVEKLKGFANKWEMLRAMKKEKGIMKGEKQ